MANILKDEHKNFSLRCIEWNVQLPVEGDAIKSERFLFQNKNCYLQFWRGKVNSWYPSLTFGYDPSVGNIQLLGTLNVVLNRKTIHSRKTISITCQTHEIWKYDSGYNLPYRQVTFELILHSDCSKVESVDKALQTDNCSVDKSLQTDNCSVDKALQIVSYMDNCFLMDGIARDFSKLFNQDSGQDVEFICGDETIKAHKSVLSCRSDAFASMLQSDLSEERRGPVNMNKYTFIINIQDMDATLLRQFLIYLYTGVLPTFTVETALKFYEAGNKYNISPLKRQCADFLIDHLLPENAYNVLILADRHNDSDLKKSVIDFMVEKEMPYSGEWRNFWKQHSILACEVYSLFCEQFRPK